MAGYECLRSNDQIDYRPLNLNIILHESDITYNLALCCLAMENIEDFKSFVNSALETAQVWPIPYLGKSRLHSKFLGYRTSWPDSNVGKGQR